jgi:hypothetical protein
MVRAPAAARGEGAGYIRDVTAQYARTVKAANIRVDRPLTAGTYTSSVTTTGA